MCLDLQSLTSAVFMMGHPTVLTFRSSTLVLREPISKQGSKGFLKPRAYLCLRFKWLKKITSAAVRLRD